jgi:tRNA-dihydrouridine synthase B
MLAKLKIGHIEIENPVLLAPMEDVTDMHFRRICRRMGADIVYSEFIASEGIVRNVPTLLNKMKFHEEERPVAIQIYGGNIDAMVESAKVVEESGADFLDINFGCWVKNVVRHNAGSALLKEPDKMVAMTKAVVDAVNIPVTVKTRLGWDRNSIIIHELAPRLEDAGIEALTIHCRTRKDGHRGNADWSWISKTKENVNIPVILNGDVTNHHDAKRAFEETGCDGVMIGRAAIGNPFIFKEVKDFLNTGKEPETINHEERINICLEHLRMEIEDKGPRKAIPEFRKHYTGYLKGLHNSHPIRQKLVLIDDYNEIEELLLNYSAFLRNYYDSK